MHLDNKRANADTFVCPQCHRALKDCSCHGAAPVVELVEASDPEKQSEDKTKDTVAVATGELIASSAATDSNIGRVIGDRYKLEEVLGTGGMGSVYRARHIKLAKPLALKMLKVNESNLAELKVRFEREALAASTLRHPQLTSVHDYGISERGEPYLVMDCVDGQTLSAAIKQGGPFSLARAINIFLQICAGMSYAHAQGILHRDLKPSNIILGIDHHRKDSATIVDFGIAKMLWSEESGKCTSTGEIIGSPSYMSPEQCQGQKLDARSDIYSVGCIMYEVLTGTPPFGGDHPVQLIFKHMNETPEFPADLLIPQGMIDLVLKCLEKDRSKRFQSADDLANALQDLKARLTKQSTTKSRSLFAKPAFIFAGCALILITAIVVYLEHRVGPATSSSLNTNTVVPNVQATNVAGEWKSDYGQVTFQISNNGHVTGFWNQAPGKLGEITDGTFDAKSGQLDFHYFEPWNQQRGSSKLHLSSDGHQLTGTWEQSNGGGTWTLWR